MAYKDPNYLKKYYRKNKARYQELNKITERKIKKAAIAAYGNKCACCGETELLFLTIDHINGRKEDTVINRLRGTHLYRWLRKNDYPKDANLRVLCCNCNFARGAFGFCPHEQRRN